MTERVTTKHDIQRDDVNVITPNFAVVRKVSVSGSLSMVSTGVDSGTGDVTIFVQNPQAGANQIGVFGQDEGVPLGTGTVINVTGQRANFSLSGTVLNLNISPDPQELIGIYGLSGTTPLGTGTSLSFGDYLLASITGTTLYVSASVGTGTQQLSQGSHTHSFTQADGWVPVSDSWVITGTTVYVPSNAFGTYAQGDRVKWTQGGISRFFVIVNLSPTTLTMLPNDDYPVTSVPGPLSNIFYSKVLSPMGYPDWFNWTPTVTGFSGSPTVNGLIKVNGKSCTIMMFITGTSNATTFTCTNLPVASNQGFDITSVLSTTTDGGAVQTTPGRIVILDTATTITFRSNTASGAWSNTLTKAARVVIDYKI